jgi:hypothetical protein
MGLFLLSRCGVWPILLREIHQGRFGCCRAHQAAANERDARVVGSAGAALLEAAEGLSGLDGADRELIDEPADNEDDKQQ